MQGPNFAIPAKNQVNNSSQNLSYTDIISNSSTGSQNQIDSLLSQSAINISVDYNNFSDFIHFSSAQTRIENFYYKVSLIESYNNDLNNLTNVTGSQASQQIFQNKISNVITNFDKFEYFMYYSSGSIVSYPKSTTEPPYILMLTGSAEVLTWLGSTNESSGNFGGLLLSASNYDNENPDELKKAIPEYLREDPENQQYDLFVDMVAQYYDSVWLYTKDITQKYNADNRLDFGVSKDLVADAIRDFGIKLYQNNFSNKELYTAFLGMTPEGSLFPFPEITGSLPAPTGFEFVDTLISASNDVISMDDTNKSLYKRIYHNIPYLLKSKGTITGLRALITSYGIPDTILRISEFGGKDQVNANDYDLHQNNFNYKINTDEGATIQTPFSLNPKWDKYGGTGWYGSTPAPETVEFRFKTDGITSAAAVNDQVIWSLEGSNALIVLEYTGSGFTSGSYDGSIADPYNEYATLKFYPNFSGTKPSASVYLPFFDGGWWSVAFTLDNPTNVSSQATLYAGNKIYNGKDGTSIGYFASSSLNTTANPTSLIGGLSNFPVESSTPDGGWNASWGCFTGSYQEIRYYNTNITENQFKDYVMNPLSFEGNSINGAPNQLTFRASLGSDLIKANSFGSITPKSIHPKVTGSWALTSSFISDSNFTINPGISGDSALYSTNTETFFLDQPAVGIKNRTTDKIRSENDTLASGSVLSPIKSLSQNIEASASYTDNINYLEVAFSPQNQINDDIIGQMGHFNIGDYIGNPAQRFSSNNYPDLNNLSEDYFKKYIKQYDLVDFVRLIKFFDNSLFKMMKDFIPARTSLASGLVVKQHLLERNKYPQPQVSTLDESEILGSVTSHKIWNTASQATEMSSSLIESFSGGAAGMFNPYNVSYNLDYFSGSMPIQTNVSGSSTGNTFNNLDTSINGLSGTFITNARTGSTKFSFFDNYVISSSKSYVPNLWVELHDNSGNLVANAFTSGSNGIPFNTDVSGSGELTMYASSNNQFTVSNISSNADAGLNFPPFINEGYIQTTDAIFDNGSGTPVASSSVSSLGSTLTTTFPTASVITNVSASLNSVTNNFGGGFINRYDIGGSTTNASTGLDFTLFVGGYVSASIDAFTDPSGNVTDKSPIQVIGSGGTNALRTLYPTSSIFTNVSATNISPTAVSENVFNIDSITTNSTNNAVFIGGYISSSRDAFQDGANSGSKSPISNFTSTQITTTLPTASVYTEVSMSLGNAQYVQPSTYQGRRFKTATTTNALYEQTFVGGYISASFPIFSVGGDTSVSSSKSEITSLAFDPTGNTQNLIVEDPISLLSTNVTATATGVNATSGNTFNTPTVTTGATTSSIFTSSPSYISSSGDIFLDPSGSSTNVSASARGTFSPSPVGKITTSIQITNATSFNFSGFDDGNAYISCSADASGHYPFAGAGEFGSGVALITNCNTAYVEVSISGRNGEYSGNINFDIMSGSAATNNTFISQSSATSSKSPITSINSNFSNLETEFITASLVENYNLSFTAVVNTSPTSPKRWDASNVVTNIDGGLASNAVIQPSTRGFIKATQTGNPSVIKQVFEDNSGNPTHVSEINSLSTSAGGIRPIFDINSTTMPADENFNFIIMTGSISDVNNAGTTFVTEIANPNITNETFTLYNGEITDTPPTTTFVSQSARSTSGEYVVSVYSGSKTLTPVTQTFVEYQPNTNLGTFTVYSGSTSLTPVTTTFISASGRPATETQMEIYSGSISLTPATQTFPSASARVVSNVAFNFHTGSVTQPGNTTFIQTTIPPEVHDRAYISSISSNTLNLDTHYSINPVGATATGFEFYNDEFGSINYFISNSILDISKEDYYYVTPPQYNVTQSWSVTTPSLSGSVTTVHRSQDEFYNGELSGSRIEVTNGELNPHCEQFKNPNFNPANYKLRLYYEEEGYNEGAFLSNQNDPFNGFIQLFYGTVPSSNLAPESPASANPPSSS